MCACRIEEAHSHGAEEKDEHEAYPRCETRLQADEQPDRYHQHQEVPDDRDAGCCGREGRGVDPPCCLYSMVPICLDGYRLEDDDQEYGHHEHQVEDVEHVDSPPDACLVPSYPEEKNQHGRLYECEDGVVYDLEDETPVTCRRGIGICTVGIGGREADIPILEDLGNNSVR